MYGEPNNETTIPVTDSEQADKNDTAADTIWENPLSVEDCKRVTELAEDNFMTYAYPKWYITEEKKMKIDQDGIQFTFVDPLRENSSFVRSCTESYQVENEPDRWAMVKAQEYLGWVVFLIKPHETNEWVVLSWGK